MLKINFKPFPSLQSEHLHLRQITANDVEEVFALRSDANTMKYILHPNYHRKGIMTEALGALMDYAFNVLKFHSLEAVIDPANLASECLLLKHNFVKEAHFKESTYFEGEFLDALVYSRIIDIK